MIDPRLRRPWKDAQGRSWISKLEDGVLCSVPSAEEARLTKKEWGFADKQILLTFLQRIKVTGWIMDRSAFRVGELPKPERQEEASEPRQEDPAVGPATFRAESLPLPITHYDFYDIEQADIAGRRIGEAVDRTTLDALRNHPKAISMSDARTGVETLGGMGYYGPLALVCSLDGRHFAEPYREDVSEVLPSPFLKGDEQLLFQATPDAVRIVVGLDLVLMQWDKGWKAACIYVPQVRENYGGNVGIAVRK